MTGQRNFVPLFIAILVAIVASLLAESGPPPTKYSSPIETFPSLAPQPTTEELDLEALTEAEARQPLPVKEQSVSPVPSPAPIRRAIPVSRAQNQSRNLSSQIFESPFLSPTELAYSNMSVSELRPGNIAVGPIRIGLQAEGGVSYNTNVFGSGSNPQGDTIFSFSPAILLQAGTRADFSIMYQPSLVYYSKFHEQNAINQFAAMSFRYKFTKLSVGFNGAYSNYSSLFSQSSGLARLETLRFYAYADYQVTRKLYLTLEGRSISQKDEGGEGIFDNNLTLIPSFHLTNRFHLGPRIRLGAVDTGDGIQSYQVYEFTATSRPHKQWEFRARAGVEFRRFSDTGAQESYPVFNVSANYWPKKYTGVSAQIYRRTSNDEFNNGSLDIQTGGDLRFSFELTQNLFLKAGVTISYIETEAEGAGQDNTTLWFASGGAKLTWAVFSNCELSIFNDVQQRFLSSDLDDYMSNVSGVNFTVKF